MPKLTWYPRPKSEGIWINTVGTHFIYTTDDGLYYPRRVVEHADGGNTSYGSDPHKTLASAAEYLEQFPQRKQYRPRR